MRPIAVDPDQLGCAHDAAILRRRHPGPRLRPLRPRNWVSNPALSAAFQALPGTNFVVFGAPVAHDAALVSAGAELRITPRLDVIAKFDGEFAAGAQTYAGSGTLRYRW